jgi:hypothetical protein
MTLKEKFQNVEICIEDQLLNLKYDENMNCVDDCVEIADDFAIGFIEWCGLRTVQITESEWANWLPNADGSLSTKSLLEIYKKEKKL